MRIGERGQVTIPKDIRDRFGLGLDTEIEFAVVQGQIILKKAARVLPFDQWKGRCADSFAELGSIGVDEFIEEIRGR